MHKVSLAATKCVSEHALLYPSGYPRRVTLPPLALVLIVHFLAAHVSEKYKLQQQHFCALQSQNVRASGLIKKKPSTRKQAKISSKIWCLWRQKVFAKS